MRQPRSVTATFDGDYLKVSFSGTYYPDGQGQSYTDNVEVSSVSIMDVDLPRDKWPAGLEESLLDLSWDLEFSE